MNSTGADWCALLGRLLLAALFLPAGIDKVLQLQDTIAEVAKAGMPLPTITGPIGAAIELLGPILLLAGLLTRLSAIALIAFTAVASFYFHNYWSGPDRMMDQINFWKNMAIIGGLFYVLGYGPGRFSLDAMLRRRR